jgi:hypothetical protein
MGAPPFKRERADQIPDPSRKKYKVRPRPSLDRQKYNEFFELERDEFLYGPRETKLHASHISFVGNSRFCPSVVGTRWSALEKEVFFTFLGRYGIRQMDKIKQHLPRKSTLEIRNYYNVLKRDLESHKLKPMYKKRLMSYAEIPEAMEVNDLALDTERKLCFKEGRYEKEDLASDVSETIVNRDSLIPMIDFHSLEHTDRIRSLKLNQAIHNSLEQVTRELIKKIVVELIKVKLHNTGLVSFYKQPDNGEIAFWVTSSEVYQTVFELGLKRPLNTYYYFRKLMKKYKMTREYDEETENAFDLIRTPLKSKYFFPTQQISHEEVEPEVIDEEEEHKILKIFMKETEELEDISLSTRNRKVLELMDEIGGKEYYLDLCQRHPDDAPYPYYKNILPKSVTVLKKEEYIPESSIPEESDDEFETPILDTITENIKLENGKLYNIKTETHTDNNDSDDEITPEMVYAYNNTYPSY